MALSREVIEDLIFGETEGRRYTQDSPVLPDVWIAYGTNGTHGSRRASGSSGASGTGADPARANTSGEPLDLLLTPHRRSDPAALCQALKKRLEAERQTAHWKKRHPDGWAGYELTFNDSCVAVRLHLDELLRVALPLTQWWQKYLFLPESSAPTADFHWLRRLIGWLDRASGPAPEGGEPEAFFDLLIADVLADPNPEKAPLLWSVSLNRDVQLSIWRSVSATKADAASRLFDLRCGHLAWAVVDSGIDATHPAFRKRLASPAGKPYPAPFLNEAPFNATRVVATYDFTRIRKLLSIPVEPSAETGLAPPSEPGPPGGAEAEKAPGSALAGLTPAQREQLGELRASLRSGRSIDWRLLEPLLRIPHKNAPAGAAGYLAPTHEHGTHVAGILAADWHAESGLDDPPAPEGQSLHGVCPDLQLYDLRVIDDLGRGNEFAVLAALQFIRWLNANKDEPVIHGVNLSLSLLHDVSNFACGRTPVCEECERLVGAGTIVVAAAGNEGYAQFNTPRGLRDGYRSISITDPGNAEGVLTVGATHRFKPHTYGVSYFSSRGPTGDGRVKPDLVAPGEKIKSTIPGGRAKTLDGTSMAAPHVSGAAALLLARHAELMGQPARVKKILCETATDLGREKFFQGCGMVDVLRALQKV